MKGNRQDLAGRRLVLFSANTCTTCDTALVDRRTPTEMVVWLL